MKEVIMQVQSFSADYPKSPIYVGDLIRCKDCEYADFKSPYPVCNLIEMNINEDSYCSWGEREEV